MKNLFFVLALLFSLTFVSADLLQVNNFIYNSSPINQVGVLGFSCSSADCSSGQSLFLSSNSGSNSFLDIAYPNSGQNTNYGLFVFKEGYIPYERNSTGYEDVSGDKRVDAVSDYLTRKDVCTSTLTNLVVTNVSNVVTIKTNVAAPINHAGGLNFVPAQIASQYSVNVTLLLKVNGSVEQIRVVNLPFSGNSEQTFSIALSSGNYNLEIESISNDAKCLSSSNQSKISSIILINNTVPPTACISFDYNTWSACIDGIQTRTVNASLPAGCLGGNLILSQTCSIADTTAPILNLPSTIHVNTTNILGANVNFNVNATDNVDGSVPVICSSLSGSLFLLGTTIVNCNATDSSGNKASGSFSVVVSYQAPSQCIISLDCGSSVILNYLCNGTDLYKNVSSPSCISGSCSFSISTQFNNSCQYGCSSNQCNVSSIDTTAPVILINSPINTTYTSNNTKINVSINENGSCFYNLGNGANKTLTNSSSYFIADENNLANNLYLLNVFCSDLYNNTNKSSVYFRINVSKNNNDNNSDDKKSTVSDSSGYSFSNLPAGNQTSDILVINKETKEVSPWALFLIFLLFCVLVLFFIVLVLLMRDRK